MYESFKNGSYEFEDKDLPFMGIVKDNNHIAIMPMINSLKLINRIHREGLDID